MSGASPNGTFRSNHTRARQPSQRSATRFFTGCFYIVPFLDMTSTARCLAICEIQQNILCHLECPGERSAYRRATYNLALTLYRAFSETALDELWRTIMGLRPLFNLLPDNVVQKSTQGKHHHFVSLCHKGLEDPEGHGHCHLMSVYLFTSMEYLSRVPLATISYPHFARSIL